MNDPIVSILILTFNRLNLSSNYVPRIVEETNNGEILIWDNFSTDGTLDWLMDYEKTKDNVRVFAGNKNFGMEAINFLAKKARGKYILKVDDDVLVPPNFAERLVQAYQKANQEKILFLGWDMAWGETTFATRSGMKLYKEPRGKVLNINNGERILINFNPSKWMINGVCRLSAKDKFIKIGGHPAGVIYGVDKIISNIAAEAGYWTGFFSSSELVIHDQASDLPDYRKFKDLELERIGSPRHV